MTNEEELLKIKEAMIEFNAKPRSIVFNEEERKIMNEKDIRYTIFKSTTTNDYIAMINFMGFDTINEIRKEIKKKGFIITDDDFEGRQIVLWLEKKKN